MIVENVNYKNFIQCECKQNKKLTSIREKCNYPYH